MTKYVIQIMIIMLIFMGGCEPIVRTEVGAYKYPEYDAITKEIDRAIGHKGYDIENPTPCDVTGHCSVCHYVD
jgi:uncharacterized protein YceK